MLKSVGGGWGTGDGGRFDLAHGAPSVGQAARLGDAEPRTRAGAREAIARRAVSTERACEAPDDEVLGSEHGATRCRHGRAARARASPTSTGSCA